MTARMVLIWLVMAFGLMQPLTRISAESLNLDAEREAYLAKSKAEENNLNRKRDSYLGTMPDFNHSATEEPIKPWIDPTASTDDESNYDPANELGQKNGGADVSHEADVPYEKDGKDLVDVDSLPVGPSDANRSDKPIEPLSPDDMFSE